MNQINPDQIKQIANLARLTFDDKEQEAMAREFAGILAMVDKLSEAEGADVPLFSNAGADENVFREDQQGESLLREKGLANAPEQADGFFKVPEVI